MKKHKDQSLRKTRGALTSTTGTSLRSNVSSAMNAHRHSPSSVMVEDSFLQLDCSRGGIIDESKKIIEKTKGLMHPCLPFEKHRTLSQISPEPAQYQLHSKLDTHKESSCFIPDVEDEFEYDRRESFNPSLYKLKQNPFMLYYY